MARRVKRQVQTPREAAEARAILARYFEAERAFPHLTQKQIAATLLPGRRDPARLIRQLRSGERLSVARKEVTAASREREENKEPGLFVATVQVGETPDGQPIIRRIDMRVPGAPSRLDVFRIARREQWKAAVVDALQQHRGTSAPIPANVAAGAQLLTVRRPKTAPRGTVKVVQGLVV